MNTGPADLDALRAAVLASAPSGTTPVVAIDGRGGSGKSSLARLLAAGIPGATIIEMDDFYLPSAARSAKPEPGDNYDRARVAEQVLQPLRAGSDGRYQRYDWDDDALAEWHDVSREGVVVLEGVYSFSDPLRPFSTYRIWVDCPYDVRLARGIARDGEAMRDKWVNEWMPAEDEYVRRADPARHAHLVLSGDGSESNGELVFSVVDGGPRG